MALPDKMLAELDAVDLRCEIKYTQLRSCTDIGNGATSRVVLTSGMVLPALLLPLTPSSRSSTSHPPLCAAHLLGSVGTDIGYAATRCRAV
eukprot:884407-Rhodomonas_salina.5